MTNPVSDVNFYEWNELPPIVIAAYAGNVDEVRSLLDSGASVNSCDPADNLSLLHIACLQGDMRLVQLILEHDAKTGEVDFSLRSLYRPRLAWQFAMNSSFYEIAELVDRAGLNRAALGTPHNNNGPS